MLREKFSVAYRKYKKDGTASSWTLYDACLFLIPFVNLKPDVKKGEIEFEESSLLTERKAPPKSPFDETFLIQLIRERPVLYDKQHEDFRAGNTRKKIWVEVARASGWDVSSVQKRWRVMRDRFVRELRRTKNIDTDNPVNCSAFFRDMLFLVRHVKSKNYEAEATDLSDASEDRWPEHQESFAVASDDLIKDCATSNTVSVKDETMQLMDETIDEHEQVVYAATDNSSYVECYESTEAVENEVYSDGQEFEENAEEYYEEDEGEEEVDEEALETASISQRSSVAGAEDVAVIQDIPQEQWFKTVSESSSPPVKKRKVSVKIEDEIQKKTTPVAKPECARSEPAEAVDEDASFGQTIGLMLKKIPARLKTSVKLKILQSIADFELQHNLV